MIRNSKNTSEARLNGVFSRIGNSYSGLKAAVYAPLAAVACAAAFGGTAHATEPKPTIAITKNNYQSPLTPSQWYETSAIIRKSHEWDNEDANNVPVSVRAVSKTAIHAGEIFPVKVTFSRVTRKVKYGNWKHKGPTYKTSKLAKYDPLTIKKPSIGYSSPDTSWIAQQLAQGVTPENMDQASMGHFQQTGEDSSKTIFKNFEQEIKFDDFKLTEFGSKRRKSFTALVEAPGTCTPWNADIRTSLYGPGSRNDPYSTPEQAQRVCPPLNLQIGYIATMNNKYTRKRSKKLPAFDAHSFSGIQKPGLKLLP
ncbi:MAG: hypothetical protein Q7T74_03335 [Candidatus Saccharibacteria bacterium]|nr:hypothetical protein [Candidatus Saccharibacteria bacterium]